MRTNSYNVGNVKISCVYIKNNVYNKNARKKNENVKILKDLTVEEMLNYMLNHKYVKENFVTENISSFNFTHEAFKKGKWDDISVKARGLFINKSTKEIVSRSYDKFFNINEQEETKINTLADNLKFPVKIYDKPNGYLGILGYDSETDELFFSSKSQAFGDHAIWFKNLFMQKFDYNKIEELKEILKDENVSLVFEVILNELDPHIIKYDSDKLILLDAIKNETHFEKLSYESLQTIGAMFKFEIKQLKKEVKTWVDFYKWYKNVSDITNQDEVEGYVIEDESGFMFKIKSPYYNFWKQMRGYIGTIAKGNYREIKGSKLYTPKHQQVLNFMRSIEPEKLKEMNIIEIRDEFENAIK